MPQPNFKNRTLFHCDNLPVLRGMDSKTVDLIATDPPFNKGRDFHATPDSLAAGARFEDRWAWDRDVHEDWVDQIRDDWPGVWSVIQSTRVAAGDDMAAFLCWLGVRLVEMHRVLRSDGSIYLHCDPTASHYLKALMDAVFGRKHFRSELIWRRTNAHNQTTRQYGPIHDVILFYSKTDQMTFHPGTRPYSEAYIKARFTRSDQRGRYQTNYLTGSGLRFGESGESWRGFDPTSAGRHWAIPRSLRRYLPADGDGMSSHQKLESLYEQGFIVFPKRGSSFSQRRLAGSRCINNTSGMVCPIKMFGHINLILRGYCMTQMNILMRTSSGLRTNRSAWAIRRKSQLVCLNAS